MQLHRLAFLFGTSTLLLLGAYACSSSDDSTTPEADAGTDTGTSTPDTSTETPDTGSTPETDSGPGLDAAIPVECNGNPLVADGGTSLVTLDGGQLQTITTGNYLFGPQYIDELGGQIVYASVNDQVIYRTGPDGGTGATDLVDLPDASFLPLQSDYFQGYVYTTYSRSFYPALPPATPSTGGGVIRTPLDGGTSTYITLPNATFASPNGIAISAKGIAFIADPGFQTDPGTHTGLFRMLVDGGAPTVVKADEQPVGVAFNKDQSKLYVSYFDGHIVYYNIGADGSPTGSEVAFTTGTTLPLYTPVGIAVDQGGNVWVGESNSTGNNGAVEIYSPDGAKKWARVSVPSHVTGVAFGGTDRKMVFITTENDNLGTAAPLYKMQTFCPGNL